MTITSPSNTWHDAAALASLHACRSPRELEERFVGEFRRLVRGAGAALCLADDHAGALRVQFVVGEGWPMAAGDQLRIESIALPESQRLPVVAGKHRLGCLLVSRELDEHEHAPLVAALAHFGTALVNLTLNAKARQDTENYCASLQALEEGVILFQEEDPEAVKARLLSLATSMVQASAGALYVLREVGNSESGLCLEQALGIPDSLLESFHGVDGCKWPDVLLGRQAELLGRADDGSIAMLAPACVPAILQSLVVLPLRYHGVEAGVCLLFNPVTDAATMRDHLSRVQSLGQLGAALLHRLRLEALNALNRSRERELQIAETIQKRLLPETAPDAPGLAFSWCAITAQSIGGDYLDLMGQGPSEVYAIVADASGHGINSALLMSSFRANYRANAPRKPLDQLAASLNNEVVREVGPTGMFITAAMLRIECATGLLQMTSAGHTPVMLFRARSGQVELVDSNGPPLGFLGGAEYTVYTTMLESGDLLLLYTDGITEAANAECDMYGEERLAHLLRQHATDDTETILTAAKRSLAAFTGRERYEDDVSLTVIRVK